MEPTARFTGRAGHYVTGRPSYPARAIDAIFDGLGDYRVLTVVDLGAGTGISSRLLAARGPSVIAVEPNAAMREVAEPMANLVWQASTAERTGLRSASADVVTAFQAFHWFDFNAALSEMRRILRADGRAAIVYNDIDESDAFSAAYGAIARSYATDRNDVTARRNTHGRDVFAGFSGWSDVRCEEFTNAQSMNRAALHARAASTSYLPYAGAAGERLRAELDALFSEYTKNDRIEIQLKTTVTIAG